MKLLKNGWTLLCVSLIMQINSFLYLMQKVPFAGWLLPADIYKKRRLKLLFAVAGMLKGFLGAAIGQMLGCVFLLSWFPKWLGVSASPEELLALYLLTKCIAPSVMSCSIFTAKEADYVFLNHFMMNPKEYYHYKIGKEVILKMLFSLPVVTYLLRDFRLIAVAALAAVFFALAGCVLYLFFYNTMHGLIKKWIRTAFGIAIIIAAYAGLRLGLFKAMVWTIPVCMGLCIGMAVLSLVCYLRLLRYQDYKRIAVEFANKDATILVISVNAAAVEGENALSDFGWEEGAAYFEKNCGLDTESYLSKAFFRRFRSVFSNQRRQIFLLSIFLGVLCGYLIRIGVLPVTEANILNYTPLLITFVTGTMLFGNRFTELCFRYMDMPLLYHRICNKEYLKKSIWRRYLFLAKHSLVALSGITLFLLLVLFISGIRISVFHFVFLLISIELFMILNELYYLLVYYFLQPYTADMSVKSPAIRVLGAAEGLFGIGVLFVRGNLAFACLPLAGLLLVMNVLLVVMQDKVDKTFRLK